MTQLLKILLLALPYLICTIAGVGGTLYITKATKPTIEVITEKVVAAQCPPCNGIDFDKIKSKNITIQNEQHLTVSGDSTFSATIRMEVRQAVKDALRENLKSKFLTSGKDWQKIADEAAREVEREFAEL